MNATHAQHSGPLIQGTLSTILAVSFLAGNGYFAKGLSTDVLTLTLIRALIAMLAIGIWLTLSKQTLGLRHRRDYPISAVAGVLLGVHWLCFFYSMNIATVTLGMTMLYTYPLMTLVLQHVCWRMKAPLASWMMAPLIIVGVFLMGDMGSSTSGNNLPGILLGLVSALCFAARNLIQQHFLSGNGPLPTIFHQTLVVGGLIAIGPLIVPETTLALHHAPGEWPMWLALGILFTAIPHSLMAFGIREIGAKSVAMIGCVQPVMAAIFAYVLLDESPSVAVITGAAIVLVAAVIEIHLSQNRS